MLFFIILSCLIVPHLQIITGKTIFMALWQHRNCPHSDRNRWEIRFNGQYRPINFHLFYEYNISPRLQVGFMAEEKSALNLSCQAKELVLIANPPQKECRII